MQPLLCVNMWKLVLLCGVISGLLVFSTAEVFVSDGYWIVYNLKRCEDPEQYPIDIDIKRRKINRTHDGFSLYADLQTEITIEDYAVHIETYKKCDGGYKFQNNFDESSFCTFINNYAKDNVERALSMANIDPPNCPIPKGVVEIKDFVIDYTELPPQYMVGDFQTIGYIVQGAKRMACLIADVSFKATDDEGDDEE